MAGVVAVQIASEGNMMARMVQGEACGDIDPMFAKFGGFERPFLHGLCTYGFAGRAALQALCGGDPARFISMSGRFSDQVYMGDSIITRIWEEGNGVAVMQVETQKGNVVLNQCRVEYRA